ncbi:MAG TPA: hypothetical protein VFT50_09015 [Baekduia sp.]|nr:hypothetical protein [Baekduia sp.]
MRRRGAMAALAAGCLLVPGAAQGATVRVVTGFAVPSSGAAVRPDDAGVDVRAAPGERNHLTLEMEGGTLVVRDPGAPLLPAEGCAVAAPGEVRCSAVAATIRMVTVDAGDGDDVVDASALPVRLAAIGGAGDDVLLGGTGDDVLSGDDGRDRLIGGPGDDRLSGGPGADRLDGGDGDDELDLSGDSATALREFATCGDGEDWIEGPDGQEMVSTDCRRVSFSTHGTAGLTLTLPLHRSRHGAWTRVSCSGVVGVDRCRVRVTLKRRNGWPPLHGRRSLGPSEQAWSRLRLRLRGARLHPREALWVQLRGSCRTAGGKAPLGGGFKVVVP